MRRPNNPSVSGPVLQCTCVQGEMVHFEYKLSLLSYIELHWMLSLIPSSECTVWDMFVWNRGMSPEYLIIVIIITKKKTWMSGIYKIYHRPPWKTASWNLRRKYFRNFRVSLYRTQSCCHHVTSTNTAAPRVTLRLTAAHPSPFCAYNNITT